MVPLVLVEISPPEQPAELSRVLVDACSSSVREGRCRLASDGDAPDASAVAIVRWTDRGELAALVQVGIREGKAIKWQARSLHFVDTDLRAERWRSIGLTIATLVGETAKPRQDSAAREEGQASRVAPLRPRPKPASRSRPNAASQPEPASESPPPARDVRRLWVNVGAYAGPGLGEKDLRVGGRIEAGWKPSRLPLFISPGVGYALRPEDGQGLSGRWLNVGVMAGWTFELHSRWNIEPRLGGHVEVMEAAIDASTSRKDSGRHIGYGADVGVQLVLRLGRVSPFADVQGYYNDRGTDVAVAGRTVGTASAAGWGVGLGVRVFLD